LVTAITLRAGVVLVGFSAALLPTAIESTADETRPGAPRSGEPDV
jgi:hypothetical protein